LHDAVIRDGIREETAASTEATLGNGVGLVERDTALAALAAAFARVAAGSASRGGLVIVSGEAGVGKTALIRRHCEERRPVARILWGACEPLFAPRPLAPLAEIARSCGGELEQALERDATPYEVVRALEHELRNGAPSIVVLEDVHWADGATLDVLRLLGRRYGGWPALVLVSHRDDELDRFHPLRRAIGELGSSESLGRIRLQPLSLEGVRAVAVPYRADAEEIYRRTGGNPFFVAEAVAAGDELPGTVRDAVLARAARLTERGWALLQAVAVTPPQAELALLESVAPDAFGSVEECLDSGLLTATDGARALQFRHELARLAVEQAIPPDRLLLLHRRALDALEAVPAADAARLAYHAEAAGAGEAVLRYAPAAAEHAASVGAHREAAAQYARALRFADLLSPERYAELCERRSLECYVTTQDDEARVATEEAIARYRELGDTRREADALRWLGLVQLNRGHPDEGERAAERAVALLERLPPGRELALAYAALAGISLLAEDAARTARWANKGLELAQQLDDVEAFVTALAGFGAAEALGGSEQGRRALEQALALATEHGLDNQIGRAHMFLVMAGSRERSLERMERHVELGLAFCEEHGLAVSARYLLAARAWVELERGTWNRAADTVSLVLTQECALSCLQARVVLALLRARRGDPDPWTPLAEADAVARQTGHLWWLGQVAAARAEAAWLAGRPDEVAAVTEDAYRLALRVQAPWSSGELALWRRRAGIEEESPPLAAEPFRLQLAGDWRGAAAWWRQSGCRYEAALALADAGDEQPLRDALSTLQQLGASPAALLVARRLRELGARRLPRGPRSTTRANPANLTPRELDVLRLLASGLRNREIASRLHLSARTVDHHVSAILGKLGARTRAQAVREAARLGMLDGDE
jgi:DNA-binding CsgD family transcriptional regulator